jgi:tetratricopeptide (TPR) repeat protein
MALTRLDIFFDLDTKARDRTLFLSVGAGILWGMFAELGLAIDFRTSAYQSLAVSVIIFAIRVWVYCRFEIYVRQAADRLSMSRRVLVGAYAYILLAILNTATIPAMEAAVLDRRLRNATAAKPLSAEATEKISKILKLAAQHDIKISNETVALVSKTIASTLPKTGLNPATLEAASVLVSYQNDVRGRESETGEAANAILRGLLSFPYFLQPPSLSSGTPNPAVMQSAKRAIAYFTEAIRLTDDDSLRQAALVLRAMIYVRIGQADLALFDALELERRDKTNALFFALEGASRLRMGDYEKAIEVLSIALTLSGPAPEFRADLYANRAIANSSLQHFTAAIEDFRSALTLRLRESYYADLISTYLDADRLSDGIAAATEWASRFPRSELAQQVTNVLKESKNAETAIRLLRDTPGWAERLRH